MAYALFIDQGLQDICNQLTSWGSPDLQLHLFTNNVTPSHSDTNGTYTDCTLSGYAPVNLNGLTWTPTTYSGQGSALSTVAAFTFSAYGGGVTIYGFFLVDSVTSVVVAAGVLDTAYPVPSGGGALAFTLEIATFPNTGPFP